MIQLFSKRNSNPVFKNGQIRYFSLVNSVVFFYVIVSLIGLLTLAIVYQNPELIYSFLLILPFIYLSFYLRYACCNLIFNKAKPRRRQIFFGLGLYLGRYFVYLVPVLVYGICAGLIPQENPFNIWALAYGVISVVALTYIVIGFCWNKELV